MQLQGATQQVRKRKFPESVPRKTQSKETFIPALQIYFEQKAVRLLKLRPTEA